MNDVNQKDIYVVSILRENFIVRKVNGTLMLVSANNSVSDSAIYNVSQYISNELSKHSNDENIISFLSKLQNVISFSNQSNIYDNVKNYFNSNTINQSSVENKIDAWKQLRDDIASNSNVYEDSGQTNTAENGIAEKGKQKVLSNGKSLLDNREAFVSALVLALLVEISGLVIFIVMLFKIL